MKAKKRVRSRDELEAEINAKVAKDPAFRRKLLKDPHAALEDLGLTVPRSMTIRLHEEKSNGWDLVIRKPQRNTKQTSDDELREMSGGINSGIDGCPDCPNAGGIGSMF